MAAAGVAAVALGTGAVVAARKLPKPETVDPAE